MEVTTRKDHDLDQKGNTVLIMSLTSSLNAPIELKIESGNFSGSFKARQQLYFASRQHFSLGNMQSRLAVCRNVTCLPISRKQCGANGEISPSERKRGNSGSEQPLHQEWRERKNAINLLFHST